MLVASLEAYGAHPDLLAAWTQHYDEALLPIQEKAVLDGNILNGGSVVGAGPTGCGKTFIGEMAATHAASEGRRAIYLVPTRALAEAKYAQFAATYRPLGIRVDISTHDRREFDARIARGEFDIAVTVPEKLWCLCASSPGLVSSVGALIVDELQMVGDPDRGQCLELLLARFLGSGSIQMVGLSAVLANGRELADWLGAELVSETRRPVELRKGVWRDGVFSYQEHNTGHIDQEHMAGADEEAVSPLTGIVELAAHLSRDGEPTMVFLRDRASSVQGARLTAELLEGPPAEKSLAALETLPRTRATSALRELLQSGVAFHNADLHFSERRVIEDGFHDGEVRCLMCTTTLAVGVNLPTRNVIVEPLKWASGLVGRPSLAPISQSDFENMAGRAGRLGYGDGFGRAILLGTAGFDADVLMRRYVLAQPEPVHGQLSGLPEMERLVLTSAVREGRPQGVEPPRLFSRADAAGGAPVSVFSDETVALAERLGLVSASPVDGTLHLTGVGKAAATSGLCIETVATLMQAVHTLGRSPSNMESLVLAAMSAEARAVPLPRQRAECRWMAELEDRAQRADGWSDAARQILWSGPLRAAEREQAAHIALIVLEWTSAEGSAELEETTRMAAGRARQLCEQVGWVVQALATLAGERACRPEDVNRLREFGDTVSAALPAECLWVDRLRNPYIQRDHAITLASAGFACEHDLLAVEESALKDLLPSRALRHLSVRRNPASRPPALEDSSAAEVPHELGEAPAARAVLVVDCGRPDMAMVNGQEISLRPMEFQLLSLLASQPRRCVSFDRVYDELWGGREIVQPQMIYWHRHNLADKLKQGMPEDAEPLVKTIPRRGLMLDLPGDQVVAA